MLYKWSYFLCVVYDLCMSSVHSMKKSICKYELTGSLYLTYASLYNTYKKQQHRQGMWLISTMNTPQYQFFSIIDVRRNHPLKLMADLKRQNLLTHKLVSSLLDTKWIQTIPLYLLAFLAYAVFLTLLTGYMLINKPPYTFKYVKF